MDPKDREVVVTGLGPVTSIGVGRDALWDSLSSGRSNVQKRRLPLDVGVMAELPVASMPEPADVPGLRSHLDYLQAQGCADYRDLAYALLAIELALADAGIAHDRENNRIGVVQAFEAPGVEPTVVRLLGMLSGPLPTDGPPRVYDALAPSFYHMQSFLYVHLIGKAFGFHGFSTAVHNACSSGAYALEIAAQHIRSGQAEVMIVAGGEAFDTAVRLEWFRRLELYSASERMCPFDPASTGFYVGEGGAAIVLEDAEHARCRGACAYARYLGGAFAHQGWKQTIPDVRAARMRDAIGRALELSRTAPRNLDLVVPHGASTLLSDGYEASCLQQALRGEARQAVATVFKPSVGHLLGACGIIETLCALLAMKHQIVPATLNSDPTTAKLCVPLVAQRVEHPINTLLKLSTGFTGHDAATVFARA